ncbi:MAG: ABC transporter substrate-binding protein [Treponemataceae bacterium]|nr:ABC transporter substrate-binding protein [Treponemataceae bacterium]
MAGIDLSAFFFNSRSRFRSFFSVLAAVLVLVCAFVSCSKREAAIVRSGTNEGFGAFAGDVAADVRSAEVVAFADLEKTGSMSLRYATHFSVDYYSVRDAGVGGSDDFREMDAIPVYRLVRTSVGDAFLLVPEGMPVPQNVPSEITPLQLPLKNVCLVATSAMDLINECGAIGEIAFSGTKAKDWSVPEATAAMEAGKIVYAGKYSAPDYELLAAGDCRLAIESTMIYHKPEVKEKLEELGIPVFVEHSSYEAHPLGRLEWIKLYGVLFGKEAVANQYYENELSRIEPIMQKSASGKSVAFFYVNSNGAVNVRKPDDYIVKMIKLAGGKYALDNLFVEEENALSTVNMMMEDFYVSCVDADILIYNGTIDTAFSSLDDLFAKSELFRDFAAVKSGRVYFASKDFYQQSTGMAAFIEDLYNVLNDENGDFAYLTKL